jgi:hypothetical protein
MEDITMIKLYDFVICFLKKWTNFEELNGYKVELTKLISGGSLCIKTK